MIYKACLLLGAIILALDFVTANASGEPAPEAALLRRWEASEELPFSFVYRGRNASKLIGSWKRTVQEPIIDATETRRTITWNDPDTGLQVRAELTIYTDVPSVDWTLFFSNRGAKDTPVLEQVKALDVVVSSTKPEAPVVLHRLHGSVCAADDWLPFDQPLPPGRRIEMVTTGGRSSSICPFFNLHWDGGGVITALGWSGQWAASVERREDGKLRVRAGMERMHLKLRPGETVRTPRILQLYWSGNDPWEAYNLFRKMMFAHILVRIDGKLVLPPIAQMSTSFYELNNTNEQNVLAHLESTKGLGFDTFWLDAYWTGPNGFPASMGNYGFPIERVEPKDRFPHGLKAIGDAVEKEGLKFLLWFEPERVAPGTLIAKEHPEWVLSPAGDGSGLLDLGNPEARKYMTDYLNAAVKAYKVSCLRIDYNLDPLPYWQFLDSKDPDRVGMTEIRYIEGLYRMWDEIRRTNPGLFIDNCASGGRRIDLETMARSLPLWRSDNTCDMTDLKTETILQAALKNQVMSAGLNRYVPFSTVGQMGSTPYLFRSGFNAGIAFAEDIRSKDYPREQLRQALAEGKRLRKYYYGNFYPLSPITTSPKDWCVMQYHRPEKQDGMLIAFRRPETQDAAFSAALHEIDPAAEYDVTQAYHYDPSPPQCLRGTQLKTLTLRVEQRPGSLVVEYRKR
ncbi:MAG: alpha-galactosidase [Pirellulales bacterium]|nr:alpha-galactosidase [Pirellulales bacterium]